ncbi:hypothetical protein GCM10007392_36100 [Saccharospirillum salsuginis]|uniref:Uncharacterized protein n=1 Tax=Saccharospirillum salsuginis TaxID=418750 RepID=A0A918NG50_9GAMM|nr:hypothetical protein GCM10007392_36100 [Saccharospirillum salsuginis]
MAGSGAMSRSSIDMVCPPFDESDSADPVRPYSHCPLVGTAFPDPGQDPVFEREQGAAPGPNGLFQERSR